MLILIDLDGVCADLETSLWAELARLYPGCPQIAPEDRKGFYIEEQIGKIWEPAINEIMHSEGFFYSLEPIPGAIEAIEKLRSEHTVLICTSPVTSPYCGKEKFEWVAKHFGDRQAVGMCVTKDKTIIRGDVLIDDKPEITGIMRPTWTQFVFDQPWNRHVAPPVARISWQSVHDGSFEALAAQLLPSLVD